MELIKLFERNYKPYDIIPTIELSKSYILNNGYFEDDIKLLINKNKIEEISSDRYRLTYTHLKKFVGNSYKYIPKFVIDKYKLN